MGAQITAAAINALSEAERIEFARGQFANEMHVAAGQHVTFFRWAYVHSILGTQGIRNGSIFFLNIDGRSMGVTAAHVYRGYQESKRWARRIVCQIGNVEFDPDRRLIAVSDKVDIATFELTHDELARIGKVALVSAAAEWPPHHPFSGQAAYYAGFPGATKLWLDRNSISFGLHIGSGPIGSAADHQISMPFERRYWIDTMGLGLPPEDFDFGGISGGPILLPMEKDGAWSFHLGGVISEFPAMKGVETVVASPAHYIAADGSINERSAPLRHAVRAA